MEQGSNPNDLGEAYLKVARQKFMELKQSAEKAIDQVSDQEINWALNEDSNSIAIIVKHLSGNMVSRWTDFLDSDGEKPNRERDDEFTGSLGTKEELYKIWNIGWDVFLDTLTSLSSEDLLRTVMIRQQPHLVIEALERQMSHYSSHIGQIIYVAKQMKSDEWSTLSIPRKK